jgi:hypothetical protein
VCYKCRQIRTRNSLFGGCHSVAIGNGASRIDSQPVIGNANLFEGKQLETDPSTPDLRRHGGARVRMAASSRGEAWPKC